MTVVDSIALMAVIFMCFLAVEVAALIWLSDHPESRATRILATSWDWITAPARWLAWKISQ